MKIIIMLLVLMASISSSAKKGVWPDGTKMDPWFENREKVDVNTLGKR